MIHMHMMHPGFVIIVKLTTLKYEKSRFLTCPCHTIYRVEAVGLYLSNYTFKIMIFVSMWNLGQFREKNDVSSMTA